MLGLGNKRTYGPAAVDPREKKERKMYQLHMYFGMGREELEMGWAYGRKPCLLRLLLQRMT